MDMNKLVAVGAALVIGVVAVLGWVLGISPKLADTSAANASRAEVETQNTAYEVKLADLKKQFESIDDLRADLASLRDAIPSGAEIPSFVAQLDDGARSHEVTLTEITVSDAEAYAPEAVVAPAPADAAASDGEAAPAAATDGAAAPPVAPAVPVVPAGNALVTAENFVAVPFSLTLEGDYGNMLAFIDGLQKGERLAMVTDFTTDLVTPGSSDAVHATISGFIYVLLDVKATDATVPTTDADALVETG